MIVLTDSKEKEYEPMDTLEEKHPEEDSEEYMSDSSEEDY